MSSPLNYVRQDYGQDRKDINRVLQDLHEIYAPPVEDGGIKARVVSHFPRRVRSTTVTTGGYTRSGSNTRSRNAASGIRRIVPSSVSSYPLTHTITGTEQASGLSVSKFGCGGLLNGSSYITITSHSSLNPTTEIGIALWIYSPATSADGIIVAKNNQYELKFTSGNGISWRIYSGGAWKTALTTTFTPNTWTHIAATYKSTSSGQKLYKNGVSVGTDSETGAIATSSNDLGIGSSPGSNTVVNNTRFAILSMVQNQVDSTWINNHMDGLINMESVTEMTTIYFAGDWTAQPNMTSPFFI